MFQPLFDRWFAPLTLGLWLLAVSMAGVARGRQFAMFVSVIVGIYSLVAVGIAPLTGVFAPLFVWLHLLVYVVFVRLARPSMRPLWYRLFVSWPGYVFAAGTLLALFWAVLRVMGFSPWGIGVPYALAVVGFVQSMRTVPEEVDLVLAEGAPPGASNSAQGERPRPHPKGEHRHPRPLRIVQISDPHLGPFMSVPRLRAICERAAALDPDLICLTGDFLTMESQSDPTHLTEALAPLKPLRGRVFACNGNHDHEAPETVREALAANDIPLLIDDARVIETKAGPVHLLGMDFTWRDRDAHLRAVCRKHPRIEGTIRIVMLHDPGAFKHLPPGEGDLVLSGHTHGGQVGLLSLGLSWTFLRLFGLRLPDHGYWARGTDRLYVHRGTGHYGFPLRLGVPAEESLLRVHRVGA